MSLVAGLLRPRLFSSKLSKLKATEKYSGTTIAKFGRHNLSWHNCHVPYFEHCVNSVVNIHIKEHRKWKQITHGHSRTVRTIWVFIFSFLNTNFIYNQSKYLLPESAGHGCSLAYKLHPQNVRFQNVCQNVWMSALQNVSNKQNDTLFTLNRNANLAIPILSV
jgi:hypothetical protein